MPVCACSHVPQYACESQRTALSVGTHFPPFWTEGLWFCCCAPQTSWPGSFWGGGGELTCLYLPSHCRSARVTAMCCCVWLYMAFWQFVLRSSHLCNKPFRPATKSLERFLTMVTVPFELSETLTVSSHCTWLQGREENFGSRLCV